MKELHEEAKKLGINSFQKGAETLAAEIAQVKGTMQPQEEVKHVRRDVDSSSERSIIDPAKRAQEIRDQRMREGFDPLAPRYKLHTVGQMPGWHYRWVAATENAMLDRSRQGYMIDESCKQESAGDNSNGLKMVRMMKPESIYREDFNRSQQRIKDDEAALRNADVKGGLKREDGAYGEISIGQSKVTLGSR